ncbi:MAG: NAD-dependent deacetylase [Alteromonadaceae bacterium]
MADFANTSGHQLLLVTQNIDNLHERAGSTHVIHMHGELLKAKCVSSGKQFVVDQDVDEHDKCQCCQPPQRIRPDIVWFGEMPYHMDEIEVALADADLFISLGTSGNVYPAAGFVEVAKMAGAKTVALNLDPSSGNKHFDEHHYGLATEVLPKFLTSL